MNFNRVFLVGKVTREIEVRKTKYGLSVGEFRLMTTHTKKNGDQEECGIDVTVWGDDADKWSEKLFEGLTAVVEGRLSFQSWDSGGETKTKHGVVASKVEKIESLNPQQAIDEEDIPF